MNLFDFEFSHIPDADIFPGADFSLVKLYDIEFCIFPRYFSTGSI